MEKSSLEKQACEIKASVYDTVKTHVGKLNAIKAGAIARTLGLPNDRLVREAIRQLRKEGRLILSTCKPPYGYFMAANLQEWVEFRDSQLKPRALDILNTSRAMAQGALIQFGKQMALLGPFSQN